MRPVARVAFYRVAPRACKNERSLAAIVACTKEEPRYGLGLSINANVDTCANSMVCHGIGWSRTMNLCEQCRAHWKAREDRVRVTKEVAKKFDLTIWRASRWGFGGLIHICRGPATKADLQRARRARAHAAKMLQRLGYAVEVTDDDGGVELLRPTGKFKVAA